MRVELPQPGDRELAVVVPGAAADQSCESDGGSVERGCEIPGPGGSLVVDDDHRRTGYGQQVDQRRDLESRVDRGVDGAELGRGREERDEIEVRRPDDRDAPTEADAEIAQPASQPVRRPIDLAKGERPLAERHRDPIGCGLGSTTEHLADQQLGLRRTRRQARHALTHGDRSA